MDADRMVQIHTQHPELELETLSAVEDKFAVKQEQPTRQILIKKGEEIVEFITPIQISTEPWGVLRLGFSMAKVAAEIAQSHKEIDEQIRGMIVKSVITAMIFLLGGFIIVFIISNRISRPLVELTHSARELANGNFSAKMPVLVSSHDEVSVLASTFADMAKNLERSYEQLAEHNLLLEQRVAERTAELNEMLERMTKSIKYAQIIQSSLLPNMERNK
jgi:nitrogen fixation/metabolism regulation signal transduction histidine kinase